MALFGSALLPALITFASSVYEVICASEREGSSWKGGRNVPLMTLTVLSLTLCFPRIPPNSVYCVACNVDSLEMELERKEAVGLLAGWLTDMGRPPEAAGRMEVRQLRTLFFLFLKKAVPLAAEAGFSLSASSLNTRLGRSRSVEELQPRSSHSLACSLTSFASLLAWW